MAEMKRSLDIYETFWSWRLQNFPEFATSVGVYIYDDKLTDMSLNGFKSRFSKSKSILDSIELLSQNLKENSLSCTNLDILNSELNTYVDGFQYETYLCPISICEGPQLDFPNLLDLMPKKCSADFNNILSRMHLLPTRINQIIDLMKEGIRKQITLHECSIYPVSNQFKSIIDLPVRESPLFASFVDKPTGIPMNEWTYIVEQCSSIIQMGSIPIISKSYLLSGIGISKTHTC